MDMLSENKGRDLVGITHTVRWWGSITAQTLNTGELTNMNF
jgi:hypothetical protein